jgi:hypothetical protein
MMEARNIIMVIQLILIVEVGMPVHLLGSFLSPTLITRLLCMDFYAMRCYKMKARLEAY